jgi:serine/threonine protein kinase
MEIQVTNTYQIIQQIGSGGMGDVFKARHNRLGRIVALKMLKQEFSMNEQFRKRFYREASIMAELQHPGIVGLFDYFEHDNSIFIIMEYAEGMALDDFMASKGGKIEEDTAVKIMLNILEAMEYAHRKNVIHRDIKPSNIMVKEDLSIKILDFGIAKLMEEAQNHHLTQTKGAVGTVYYMSPEQVKREQIDLRTDIYSLGVLFYQMLSGNNPYENLSSEYQISDAIVRHTLPEITSEFFNHYPINAIIAKATKKNREERFQDCKVFLLAFSEQDYRKINEVENNEPIEKKVYNKKKQSDWLETGDKIAIIFIIMFLILLIIWLKNK